MSDIKNNVGYENEGFDETTLKMESFPILTLAQSQTPEVITNAIEGLKAGMLMNNVTKLPVGNKVEVVAYKMWPSRAKFPPRNSDLPVECYSVDGVTGVKYGKCATCAYSKFSVGKDDRCQDQTTFVVAPVEEPNNLFRVIFSRKNAKTGSKLERMLATECRKEKLPIYGKSFTLSTKQVKNDKANAYYYVFTVDMGQSLDAETIADIRENFLYVSELRKTQVDAFYANAATGAQVEDEELPDFVGGTTDEDADADAAAGSRLL